MEKKIADLEPNHAGFNIGDAIKHSYDYLRPMRDFWLSQGREPFKSNAKDNLEKAKLERGIITGMKRNQWSTYAEIKWDNGTTSQTAFYLIEKD
jgi:hypothetical protein